MKNRTPHLAENVASIADDLRAHAAARTGALAVLFALIDACLLRILNRLTALVTLWQAGQLPQPIACMQTPRHSLAASPTHRHAISIGPRRRTPMPSNLTGSSPITAAPRPVRLAQHPQSVPALLHPPAPALVCAADLRHRTAFPLDPRSKTPRCPSRQRTP